MNWMDISVRLLYYRLVTQVGAAVWLHHAVHLKPYGYPVHCTKTLASFCIAVCWYLIFIRSPLELHEAAEVFFVCEFWAWTINSLKPCLHMCNICTLRNPKHMKTSGSILSCLQSYLLMETAQSPQMPQIACWEGYLPHVCCPLVLYSSKYCLFIYILLILPFYYKYNQSKYLKTWISKFWMSWEELIELFSVSFQE